MNMSTDMTKDDLIFLRDVCEHMMDTLMLNEPHEEEDDEGNLIFSDEEMDDYFNDLAAMSNKITHILDNSPK